MISPMYNTSIGKVILVNIPYSEYLEHISDMIPYNCKVLSHNITIEVIKDVNGNYSYSAIGLYTSPQRLDYLKSIGVYPIYGNDLNLLVAKTKLSNRELYKVIFDEVELILSK